MTAVLRIDSDRNNLIGWRHFWGKKVVAFDDRFHCARCLVGSQERRVHTATPVNVDIPLPNLKAGDVFYICGVATPWEWANNLHLACRVVSEQNTLFTPPKALAPKASVLSYVGDRVTVTGAILLPFGDEIASKRYPDRDRSFLTCRNFQFGAEMVDTAILVPYDFDAARERRLAREGDKAVDRELTLT